MSPIKYKNNKKAIYMYSKCVLGYSMLLNMVSGAISFLKVIVRRERQMVQLRHGLKDIRVLKMLKERPESGICLVPQICRGRAGARGNLSCLQTMYRACMVVFL